MATHTQDEVLSQPTYVGTVTRDPMFPIEFWNIAERIQLGIPKTSNFAEGFHNKFRKMHRPPMWKFLYTLLQIQQKTENSIRKFNQPSGLARLRNKKYRQLNEKIVELCFIYEYDPASKLYVFKKWILSFVSIFCQPF